VLKPGNKLPTLPWLTWRHTAIHTFMLHRLYLTLKTTVGRSRGKVWETTADSWWSSATILRKLCEKWLLAWEALLVVRCENSVCRRGVLQWVRGLGSLRDIHANPLSDFFFMEQQIAVFPSLPASSVLRISVLNTAVHVVHSRCSDIAFHTPTMCLTSKVFHGFLFWANQLTDPQNSHNYRSNSGCCDAWHVVKLTTDLWKKQTHVLPYSLVQNWEASMLNSSLSRYSRSINHTTLGHISTSYLSLTSRTSLHKPFLSCFSTMAPHANIKQSQHSASARHIATKYALQCQLAEQWLTFL